MTASLSLSLSLFASLSLAAMSNAGGLRYELVSIVSPTNVSAGTAGNVVLREINGSLVAVGYYESVTGAGTVLRPLVWSQNGTFGFSAGTGTDISAIGPFQYGGRLNDINETGGIAGGRYDSSGGEEGLELQLASGPSATSNIWNASGISVALGINDGSPATTVGSRRVANCLFSDGQYTAVSNTFMSTSTVIDLATGGQNYNAALAVQTASSPLAVGDTGNCGAISECDPSWDAGQWAIGGSSVSFFAEGGTTAYSRAENVNDAGEAVGAVFYASSGTCRPRAVLWYSLSSFLELGPMLPGASSGGSYGLKTYASDLSNTLCDRQFVVGRETSQSRAVAWWRCDAAWEALWIDESLSPLQPGVSSLSYENAVGVNDAGWTVGYGVELNSSLLRGFVLKPILCPSDLDGSGTVDAADLAILLGQWGCEASPGASCWRSDITADGMVGAADMAVLLGAYGTCPCQCEESGAGGEGQAASNGGDSSSFDPASILGFGSNEEFFAWASQLSIEQLEAVATLLRAQLQGGV